MRESKQFKCTLRSGKHGKIRRFIGEQTGTTTLAGSTSGTSGSSQKSDPESPMPLTLQRATLSSPVGLAAPTFPCQPCPLPSAFSPVGLAPSSWSPLTPAVCLPPSLCLPPSAVLPPSFLSPRFPCRPGPLRCPLPSALFPLPPAPCPLPSACGPHSPPHCADLGTTHPVRLLPASGRIEESIQNTQVCK